MATTTTPESIKQIHYLAAALKAPRITAAAQRLADQARDAGWTHEDYLAAVLEREVSARNASGAALATSTPRCAGPTRWRHIRLSSARIGSRAMFHAGRTPDRPASCALVFPRILFPSRPHPTPASCSHQLQNGLSHRRHNARSEAMFSI